MSLYIHELLCVDALGDVSVVHLTVEDDDPNLETGEPGAVYTLDGSVLPATPAVDVVQVAFTLVDGTARNGVAMSFSDGGNTYYILPDGDLPDLITSVDGYFSYGPVGSIAYTGYGFSEGDLPRPYQGLAFFRSASAGGPVWDDGAGVITVYDDDNRIETTAETGALAQGHTNYHGNQGAFANTAGLPALALGATTVQLVQVTYSGTTGTGTFEALEFTFVRFGTTYFAYVPRKGESVDLAAVVTITGLTVLPGSVDGSTYGDFGLNGQTTAQDGTSGSDLLRGDWLHDEFKGKGGADTLAGGLGEDRLYGDGGADQLFGGMHADTLEGGGGNDLVHGRSYDDSLLGQDGADSLFGGYGIDTIDGGKGADLIEGNEGADDLTGGKGNDTILGADGNDTLDGSAGDDELRGGVGDDQIDDGDGADTLVGGSGVDTFVFADDGTTDTVSDFKDGIDLLDVSVRFGRLTLTDVAPGEVHVTYSGETLILRDAAGTLTAADLTTDDFI